MIFHGKARNYKFYITISCGVTKEVKREYFKSKLYKKDSCDLNYTTADCNFFYGSLTEDHYDTGVKEKHVRLINPTLEELNSSLEEGVRFLNKFNREDDWKGGNIIFIFSGHGTEGSGALCLKDNHYTAKSLLETISKTRIKNERRLRLDLILDSCFSGAFIIHLIEEAWNNFEEEIFLCDMWGSSSFNEVSYEYGKYKHGLFTYVWKSKQEVMEKIGGALHLLVNYKEELRTVEDLTDNKQNPIKYVNGALSHRGKMVYVYELEEITYTKITAELK